MLVPNALNLEEEMQKREYKTEKESLNTKIIELQASVSELRKKSRRRGEVRVEIFMERRSQRIIKEPK